MTKNQDPGRSSVGVLNTVLGDWVENRLLKGGSYVDLLDYATRELQHFRNLDEYIHFFVEALPTRLNSNGALIFLAPEPGQDLVLRGVSPSLGNWARTTVPTLTASSDLGAVIQATRTPIPLAALLLPTAPPFSAEDASLLEMLRTAHIELLLPLISNQQGRLIGLVALSTKETDESYSGQELTALTTLARTAG